MKTKNFYTDLRNTIIDRLNDYKNIDVYGSELAYTLFESENANGSVLCNTYKTKEFIKENFDLFADFSEYYKDNFGESLDIFSEPEKAHVILLLEAAQMVLSKLDRNESFLRTKCIQNELFYRENKDYVKQNKKCAIINNEPYIYNNVNLERAY